MSNGIQTSFRSCNLCEAICGLAIEHDGQKVISIKGDKDDPLSRGHICPKAIALQDIHADPDRLRTPVRRTDNGFEPISWNEAFDLIEEKLGSIRREHGDDAVALYLGNPTVHNSGALLFQKYLKQSLNTRNQFAATSVDQLPHHLAASLMFGHSLMIPVPDIDNTRYMLILGANPAASNGSLMTAPDVKNRIKSISERGGKVLLLDPRKTETAKLVDEHHFIRPGTDVYFLAAILNVILSNGRSNLGRLEGFTKNIPRLHEAVQPFAPETVARITGVNSDTISEIANEFASAKGAVVYGRMGVSTQPHGSLCHWLINAINLVTGNLDRQGGQMFAQPAVNIVGKKSTTGDFGRWKSRVRGLPEFAGDLPVAVLAEEIMTPGIGQVRALFTNSGNPVLSTPNGTQLERAIKQLDFFVALDIYINETTCHADLILPSPTGLETNHYDFIFTALAVRNVANYSQQLFEPDEGSLYDWQILKELSLRLTPASRSVFGKTKRWGKRMRIRWLTPERLLDLGLRFGPYGIFRKWLSLNSLKKRPHGIDFGELRQMLPKLLKTTDKKIDAAPELYIVHLQACAKEIQDPAMNIVTESAGQSKSTAKKKFQLIGRRHLRSNNSWMHNSQRLVKGPNRCTAMINTLDAQLFELTSGQQITLTSKVGTVIAPVEISDDIMQGVVSLPHGYGHHREGARLSVASSHAGVSINDLTDDKAVDSLTGNTAFSGQWVTLSKTTSELP